jgi:hypothetical protein
MSAYIKNTEISQINDTMLYQKPLEKQEKAKPNKQKERNNKNEGQNQ